MNNTARVRGRTLLVSRGFVVVISLAPTLVYLFVALHRIGYPYELEWLEGGAVEIAGRVAHEQAIYVAPSIHYVPYPYTPLYFWITGTLAHGSLDVGFLPLRLVSLVSSLGACAHAGPDRVAGDGRRGGRRRGQRALHGHLRGERGLVRHRAGGLTRPLSCSWWRSTWPARPKGSPVA